VTDQPGERPSDSPRTDVFGDVVPVISDDERAETWGDVVENADEEALRREVPPHHG
jgi:hypothetical protein